MPRTYKHEPGARVNMNYSKTMVLEAVRHVRAHRMTLREASEVYGIPRSTLQRHVKGGLKNVGGQPVLGRTEENSLVKTILTASEWGYPFEKIDIRYLVKSYLDRSGRKESRFNNNLPGEDWVNNFYQRHKDVLTVRLSENIKRSRAAISRDTINEYFEHVSVSLENVSPDNLVNYDETNFTDDPGRKKVIVRRSCKHAERVIDSSKSATSVMFAVTASGLMLPPFVVYKSENLYQNWMKNGPKDCRFGRSKSGWFDQCLFEEWFYTIICPYFRRKEGPKVLIGDNLASHLSVAVINECEKLDIKFVLLPPNSTHLTQPLDVAVFRPIKTSWRNVLTRWKKKNKGVLPKELFPSMLNTALTELGTKMEDNIKAGFSGTGLMPLDKDKVLKRLPNATYHENSENSFQNSLIELFKATRESKKPQINRKKKINVPPGKSINPEDLGTSLQEDETLHSAQPLPGTSCQEKSENYIQSSFIETRKSKKLQSNKKKKINISSENNINLENLEVDLFVEVQLETHSAKKRFVARIIQLHPEITVTFLVPNRKIKNTFVFPNVPDVSLIDVEQIKKILEEPIKLRRGGYQFNDIMESYII